jgi:hypothetical protein
MGRGRLGGYTFRSNARTSRRDNDRFPKPNNERTDDEFGFSNGFWNKKRLRLRFRTRLRLRLRLRFRRRRRSRYRSGYTDRHDAGYEVRYGERHDVRYSEGNNRISIWRTTPS